MKTKIILKGIFIFILLIVGSFLTLYLILEPIVQSAYEKGYDEGSIGCEREYEQPVMNPFGDFEITYINYSNWTFERCCYPTDCLPEALDNPENCTCTYAIYCSYIWNAS